MQFFNLNNLTEEKAYILGFLTTDGSIDNKWSFRWQQSNKDNELLIKLNDYFIKNNFSTSLSLNSRIIKHKTDSFTYSRFSVNNKELVQELINLGFDNNKTFTAKMLDIPDNMFFHYVRGLIDGDGWLHTRVHGGGSKSLRLEVGFCSASYDLISKVVERITNSLDISSTNILTRTKESRKNSNFKASCDFYQVTFYSKKAYKIAQVLYGNNPKLYLKRKSDIVLNFKWENLTQLKQWKFEEDKIILDNYGYYGSAKYIQTLLPHRSINAIRNRYLILIK